MSTQMSSSVSELENDKYLSNSGSNLLADSLNESAEMDYLLNKSLPNYRQAYSDRTAWLMACISELSYIKFNPLFKSTSKHYFIKKMADLVGENNTASLDLLINAVSYDAAEEEERLKNNASLLGLKLARTFDHNGSQAILLENDQYLFLAFRGTEATSIKDIKADLNTMQTSCPSGGGIHSGFNLAFNNLAIDIQTSLNQVKFSTKPLFITGHSLGGALATVATKKLQHSAGIAACYTFGSPRVGDATWTENIKTPVYRMVNAADPVTMLPPSSETISLLAWLSGFIPYVGSFAKKTLLSKLGGYLHLGDMRYLSDCHKGDYKKVKLLYAVSFLYRLKAFLIKKTSFAKIPGDHSISVYRKKLLMVAGKRNQ